MRNLDDYNPTFNNPPPREMVQLTSTLFIQERNRNESLPEKPMDESDNETLHIQSTDENDKESLPEKPMDESDKETLHIQSTDESDKETKTYGKPNVKQICILLVISFLVLYSPVHKLKPSNNLVMFLLQAVLITILFWVITRFFY